MVSRWSDCANLQKLPCTCWNTAGVLHDAFSQRCDYALELLLAYANALKPIRDGGLIDHDTYMNGM